MIDLEIQTASTDKMLLRLEERIRNPRPVLVQLHTYMMRRTDLTFRKLRHGGTFRGVTWDRYADQYTRKGGRDGRGDKSTIPAWGGIPKVRGGGMVKGRLRPSGRRITKQSNLLRDTGRLATAAGMSRRFTHGGRTLRMTTRSVKYGPEQQEQRPFLFFKLPRDLQVARRIAKDHLERKGK